MKKLAALTLSMFLVSGTAFADTPKNADPQPAKAQPAKPKAAKKAEKSDAAIAAQLEELRQALALRLLPFGERKRLDLTGKLAKVRRNLSVHAE